MATGWHEKRWQRNISHSIWEENGFTSYFANKSRKSRYNIKKEMSRLEENGHLVVTQFRRGEINEKIINRIAEIQKKGWLIRLGVERINSSFQKEIIKSLAEDNLSEVFILSKGSKDIAYILNYYDKTNSYCISIGFDEEYESLSPGKVLMANCIRYILDRGIKDYDFLLGDGEYKRFWGNRTKIILCSICFKGFGGWILSWYPYRIHGFLREYKFAKNVFAKAEGILARRGIQ
jgi:CelD/BcsL family acetyltransferase involved in cellulose biosynthesis